MQNRNTDLSRLIDETLTHRQSRRTLVRQAAALGISAPLAVRLTRQRAAAQDATPMAAPEGEPITLGAAVSTTGSNGRTGLYQQEAYLLWEEQKNAAQECDAERGETQETRKAFEDKYGSNGNKRNAFGKCVSQKEE